MTIVLVVVALVVVGLVAWGIAFWYARRANAEFDTMAAELVRDAEKIGRRP